MAHADLGARFHFASTLRRWVPYLQAAVSGRGVTVSGLEIDANSSRLSLGLSWWP